jgi:hypothetical protein
MNGKVYKDFIDSFVMMSQNIPESYRLHKIAETVARRIGVDLTEPQGRDRTLYDAVMSFGNPTDHLIQLTIRRGEVNTEVILAGEQNQCLIHYSGATSKSSGKPIETIYATDSKRVIAVTWGYPEDVGVLEVCDVKGSVALQELSGVTKDFHGRPGVVFNMLAPKPQSYFGIAQFRDGDFDKLHRTIETLLE